MATDKNQTIKPGRQVQHKRLNKQKRPDYDDYSRKESDKGQSYKRKEKYTEWMYASDEDDLDDET